MRTKKNTIYNSSQQALWKIFILIITIGVSVFASLLDNRSCYITIFVQACNNIYDFFPYTNNKKYEKTVKNQAIGVVFTSGIMIIGSIVALLEYFPFTDCMLTRLFGVFLVALPIIVIYNDYRINEEKEG